MKKAVQEEQPDKENAARNSAIGLVVGMLLGGLVDLFTGDYGIATIIGMILGALLGYRSAGGFHFMEYPPQAIRYLVISGALFLVSLLAFFFLIERQIGSDSSIIIALVSSLLCVLFVLALGYAISTLDDLQRRIQVEAIAIGFGITAPIALAIGLLGLAGMHQPGWLLMTPIMVGAWFAGKLWTRWRYH